MVSVSFKLPNKTRVLDVHAHAVHGAPIDALEAGHVHVGQGVVLVGSRRIGSSGGGGSSGIQGIAGHQTRLLGGSGQAVGSSGAGSIRGIGRQSGSRCRRVRLRSGVGDGVLVALLLLLGGGHMGIVGLLLVMMLLLLLLLVMMGSGGHALRLMGLHQGSVGSGGAGGDRVGCIPKGDNTLLVTFLNT